MTDLRPYQAKREAPLTGGARFIRGFTRIGAVAAALVTLVGIIATIVAATSGYNDDVRAHESAKCVAGLARTGYTFKRKHDFSDTLDYEVGGCSDSGIYGKPVREVLAMADAPVPIFMTSDGASALGVGLIITGICAIAAYVTFWVIGWMFAGFTRDA
jgi:hypothetical protein